MARAHRRLTGMNEAGLALVVHGGRARESKSSGEPLVHTMRDVLGEARSTDDAIRDALGGASRW